MLQQLQIKNFAIIKKIEIEFSQGFTVITGETGVGKSIVIDALGLCLGNRSENSMIRNGCATSDITAVFNIKQNKQVLQWLQTKELIDANIENECIIRRVISLEGKSKAFINGNLVTVGLLKELSDYLIKIYGQHNQQLLLKQEYQLNLLDYFLKNHELRNQMQMHYNQWYIAKAEYQKAITEFEQYKTKLDLLTYQVSELQEISVHEGEYEKLENDYKLFSNSTDLLERGNNIVNILKENDEYNVCNLLFQCNKQLNDLSKIDIKYNIISEYINNALIQIQEASDDLNSINANIEINPEQLLVIENRLNQINTIARKHKINPEKLFAYQQQLYMELDALNNYDNIIDQLKKQESLTRQQAIKSANNLHMNRSEGAKIFGNKVTKIIKQLAMEHAEFSVDIEYNQDNITNTGSNKITFNLKSNLGQQSSELAKIASGGELSRLCLAIQTITNIQDINTIIFDEIDTGISGTTAMIVGRLLQDLGQQNQIISVTHLPQVACFGDQQLSVDKKIINNETETIIHKLEDDSRVQALARLLGSANITAKAMDNAREMLQIAKKQIKA